MEVVEYVKSLTLGEVFAALVIILGVISAFIEWNKSIPAHPLTAFFSWLGKCFTQSINTRLDGLEKQIKDTNKAVTDLQSEMDTRFKEAERASDEKEMKRLRASIICFSDSCGKHEHHTKSHFDNIFRDIDDYNSLCEKHDFPNHFIEGEVRYIESVFDKCQRESKFLRGGEEYDKERIHREVKETC